MKLSSSLFDFLGNFKKGADFYRVFRKLSFVNQPGFLWRNSHKNPGFFYFKKGAGSQHPIHSRSPVPRRTAFFVSYEQYPVPEKERRRKWRVKVKNPNQASSKPNRTRPEYRSHTGPPAQTEKPVCTASPLCEGCPFPGHGFLCRGEDGECMRTRLSKLSERRVSSNEQTVSNSSAGGIHSDELSTRQQNSAISND